MIRSFNTWFFQAWICILALTNISEAIIVITIGNRIKIETGLKNGRFKRQVKKNSMRNKKYNYIRKLYRPIMTMTMLKKGDKAPDFKLYNTEKQVFSLSEMKGQKVVLLFFPLAFTSTCTAELCSVRDDISNYSGMDAKVFGISVDSAFSLKKFKEEQNLNFELLSDFNKEASTAYACLYDTFVLEMKGVSKRSAFVIDAEGIIQYAEVLESAGEIPQLDQVKAILSQL